jgi:hypothetical protein
MPANYPYLQLRYGARPDTYRPHISSRYPDTREKLSEEEVAAWVKQRNSSFLYHERITVAKLRGEYLLTPKEVRQIGQGRVLIIDSAIAGL